MSQGRNPRIRRPSPLVLRLDPLPLGQRQCSCLSPSTASKKKVPRSPWQPPTDSGAVDITISVACEQIHIVFSSKRLARVSCKGLSASSIFAVVCYRTISRFCFHYHCISVTMTLLTHDFTETKNADLS